MWNLTNYVNPNYTRKNLNCLPAYRRKKTMRAIIDLPPGMSGAV